MREGPPDGWLPREAGLWRDPRPPIASRYAVIAFLLTAAVFAGISLAAGFSWRSAIREVPLANAAGPALVIAPKTPSCAPASNAVPFVAAQPPVSGRVETFALDGRRVLAYVPVSHPAPGLPVVYFLHGAPGTAGDWTDPEARVPAMLDRMEATGELPPMIAIFPDGNRGAGGEGSWWGNTLDGAAMESWFVNRLVPIVDGRYPTLGAVRRGIAGFSAGGFGAVNLALRHPGMFAWVASYSGVFAAPVERFGSAAIANSPVLTVGALPASRRFPLFVGAGADDWEFRAESDAFVNVLRSIRYGPLLSETVPGPHTWQAWAVEVRDSLTWLGRLWATPPATTAAAAHPAAVARC